ETGEELTGLQKKSFLLLTDNRLIFLFYSKDILSKKYIFLTQRRWASRFPSILIFFGTEEETGEENLEISVQRIEEYWQQTRNAKKHFISRPAYRRDRLWFLGFMSLFLFFLIL
ncbi:hypothetical protein ACJX0J_035783, partial [Zea mays]